MNVWTVGTLLAQRLGFSLFRGLEWWLGASPDTAPGGELDSLNQPWTLNLGYHRVPSLTPWEAQKCDSELDMHGRASQMVTAANSRTRSAKDLKKRTKWPQHYLDMFKVKGVHMHATYSPRSLKYSSVSIYYEPFSSYKPILWKHTEWPQNLDMFRVKGTHMHTTCIHEAQIFMLFTPR